MKKFIQLFIICLCLTSTLGAQSKKEQKKLKADKEFAQMKTFVQEGAFDFRAEWATPLQGNRVNLTTNDNFLRFRKDSADIYLPYFGTLRSGNDAITGRGGIVYQGTVKDVKFDIDEKKQKITMSFIASGKTDVYDFNLTLFSSGKTLVNVNSNYRTNIKYSGKTKEADPVK